MAATLEHRGPDDSDVWVSSQAPLGLGHTRLSVVDLTSAGHQPMTSPDGQWVMVYNGEVYNAAALRRDLVRMGITFRGSSDTEILLAGISSWGLRSTLQRVDGMFALAVWDRRRRELHLARDRMGEKPLYFGRSGSAFLFGSELKAIRAYQGFSSEVDRDGLAQMLLTGYVPGPRSIYAGISKLQPGRGVTVSPTGGVRDWQFWDLRAIAIGRSADPARRSTGQLVDQAETVLAESVSRQLVADVPVGTMLSGGIDSSLVTALAQRVSSSPVRTFTVGFSEDEYDESDHARSVASRLGTSHTEIVVTPQDAMNVIPDLPMIYDEPFGDSSQIPTVLISRLAREDVTVALTGDGGDELFGGYARYGLHGALGRLASVPPPLRKQAARLLRAVPDEAWSSLGRSRFADRIPGGGRRLGERVQKGSDLLAARDMDESAYATLMTQQLPHEGTLVFSANSEPPFRGNAAWDPRLDRLGRMRLLDQTTYLPDDLLVKVDRAAMSASLETRAPMLARDVVEFAWTLPSNLLRRHGEGKWILREVLSRHLPRVWFDRPKMGFGVPVGQWLRGPLRAWGQDLVTGLRADPERFVNSAYVDLIWREHLEGRADHAYLMWHILMFQAWREAQA